MMDYDTYISTEPEYLMYDEEEEMNRFIELALDDEDREMETLEAESQADQIQNELQYKDEVAERLLEAVDEFLTFSTARELIKLIANNL